jgi:hypothetical protein
MEHKELIALLPLEERTDGRKISKVLVRLGDGRMAIEDLGSNAGPVPLGYRRSCPILDPMTREVIGYEMEQVVLQASA